MYILHQFEKIFLKRSISFVVFLFIFPQTIYSGTVTEQSPLDFGTIALIDNLANYQLRVRYTGQIIKDPQVVIISTGLPGEYYFSGFPASTLLNITVSSASSIVTAPSSPNPSNPNFTISNFDYLPALNTDVNGDLTFYLGATITTSGTGTYSDSIYITDMNINISF